MTTTAIDDTITQKTLELCQTILETPQFQAVRQQIDTFMANDVLREQYQNVIEKGEFLNHKQGQGVKLSPDEVQDFETQRDLFVSNPVARGFLDAQEEMHQMQESVSKFLSKTFELGRVPNPNELESGSCGSGCGCH